MAGRAAHRSGLPEAPAESATELTVAEELLSSLSGASVNSNITIPDRAIVLGVSVAAISGAASYSWASKASPRSDRSLDSEPQR